MQTILGSGGAIGRDLARELKQYTDQVRLVSRHPQAINADDELHPADLSNPANFDQAVAGSDVVYLTVGFEYNIKVWRKTWPQVVKATIEACEKHGAKLVFFDNVYSYDINAIPHMTEESPLNPPSKKGAVRKELLKMIFDAVQAGRIEALVARGADFYGPKNTTSFLIETIYKPLKQGKAATILASAKHKHTYTYTPDAAKATAILGNTPDAYNQTWHVPTDPNGLTQQQWVELFAKELNVKPKYNVIPKFAIGLLGLFVPFMRETHEMLYQWDRDYLLDSSKFEQRFNFKPTPYVEGVKATIQADR
ncbi:MAG: NAD-dependent epimerase/dehydratase family protein [Saprospiraceae bacterium]